MKAAPPPGGTKTRLLLFSTSCLGRGRGSLERPRASILPVQASIAQEGWARSRAVELQDPVSCLQHWMQEAGLEENLRVGECPGPSDTRHLLPWAAPVWFSTGPSGTTFCKSTRVFLALRSFIQHIVTSTSKRLRLGKALWRQRRT